MIKGQSTATLFHAKRHPTANSDLVFRRNLGILTFALTSSLIGSNISAGQTTVRAIPADFFLNIRFISIINSVRIWQDDAWRYISGGAVTDARAMPGGVLDVDFDIQGLVISTARQNFKIRLSSLSRLHLIPILNGKGEPLPHGTASDLSRDLYIWINLSAREHRRDPSTRPGSDIDLELRWNYVLQRGSIISLSFISDEKHEFGQINSYDLTSFVLGKARECIFEIFQNEFVVD